MAKTAQTKKLSERQFTIDVDIVAKKWNLANPDKKPLDRDRMAQDMEAGKQMFSDWKSKKKKTPQWVGFLMYLIETGDYPKPDFIIEIEETEKV